MEVKVDDDIRTFPLAYSGTTRVPSYGHNVAKLTEEASTDEWTITGPRTTKWLLDNMRIQELQPVRRHWWWRQTLQINANSEGCDEHLFISELLEAFVGFDGINLVETQAGEMLARRYQLWEQMYAGTLQECVNNSSLLGAMAVDEKSIFLGATRSNGAALVSPALEKYVASQLQERASVQKERRKAKEEATAAANGGGRPPRDKKKKGKGEGKGDG